VDIESRGEAIDRAVAPGILAGLVAALVMGLFAMLAAAAWRHLPFTMPLREIAAVANPAFADPPARGPGGQQVDVGRDLLVFAGAIHLAVGGLFGALFALLARMARLRGRAAVAAGLLYGLGILALTTALVLPLVGRLTGAGEPISNLAGRMGWGTFTAAHLLFGLALGLWVLVRPSDVARDLTVSRAGGGGGRVVR
jgi:hypothetical protein